MTAPIITVTLNPAIDLTITLDSLKKGEVQRAKAARSDVGGKGINVAGCLADWGSPVIATGILGRANQPAFTDFFSAKGITDRFITAPGETRTNIKIIDGAGGDTTDINLPGLTVTEDLLEQVIDVLTQIVAAGSIVVLAGSLPNGLPATTWATLTGFLNQAKARVVLDTSGPPLAAALEAARDALPYAIKPNRSELEAWAGHRLPTTPDLVDTARTLIDRGVKMVVVSLGSEGALFVTAEQAITGRLPPVAAMSTVGAGDAMVAGLVSALSDHLTTDALARRAVAFATGKLARIGPHLPTNPQIELLAEQVTTFVLPG